MSKYTEPQADFKLVDFIPSHSWNRKNMRVWEMVMNRLSIPTHLHEFIRAVYITGNWEQTEWEEIPLMRMAKNLSTDDAAQIKAFNRLKQNSPKFFEWQDSVPFEVISREILREKTTWNKTKAKYNFLLYDVFSKLLALSDTISIRDLRKEINRLLAAYPEVQKPQRAPRKKRKTTVVKSILRNLEILVELDGSPLLAAVSLLEVHSEEVDIPGLAMEILRAKDL